MAEKWDVILSTLGLAQSDPVTAALHRRYASSARLDELSDLVALLRQRLKNERIPRIIRTIAEGLDGRTILDLIAGGETQPVVEYMSRLASYTSS